MPVDGSSATNVGKYHTYQGDLSVNLTQQYGASTGSAMQNDLLFQFHSDSAAVPNPGVYGYLRVYFEDD